MELQKNIRFRQLFAKYSSGECTPDEVHELFAMMSSGEFDDEVNSSMKEEFDQLFPSSLGKNKSFRRILSIKTYLTAAASLVLIIGIYYLFFFRQSVSVDNTVVAQDEVIQPGHNQAILILDGGKRVVLDSSAKGKIAKESGTVISLNEDGELHYNTDPDQTAETIRYNTVSVPAGGIFKIVLPDGSNVWLNSESQLTFPARFSGNQRQVSLKGEGYFEVAKNRNKPFIVQINEREKVTVLGTIFNVMAYSNEPLKKITLLEGSIDFSDGKWSHLLKPGQQALVNDENTVVSEDVIIDHEIAWKNGLFDFQNDDLPSIMRRLSRWYKVDIVYGNESHHSGHYTGSIRKSSGIQEVLKMLKVAGDVNFSIVGNKIIVNEK